jgi:hypothetical protein
MGKRPQLNIEGNKKYNFELWRSRFDAFCLTEGYRNPAKDPSEAAEHDQCLLTVPVAEELCG